MKGRSETSKSQSNAKERAAQGVHSWTAQNDMRSILERCPQALRSNKSLTEGCVRCSENEKGQSERD